MNRNLPAMTLIILLLVSFAASAQSPENDVRAFVRQIFFHGVPFEEASRFDVKSVPVLLEMLNDPAEDLYWPNIAVTLAMIGDDETANALIAFIEKSDDKMSRERYLAKASAIMSLGYLSNRLDSRRAMSYLKESVDPTVWKRRGVRWASPVHRSEEERDVQLSTMAVLGLALSGRPEAAEAMKAVKHDRIKPVVADALRDHEAIKNEGLHGYYRRRPPASPPGNGQTKPPESDLRPQVPPDVKTGAAKPPAVVTGRPAAPAIPAPHGKPPQLPPPAMTKAPAIPPPAASGPPK